ncbi:transcriptional regulatory protein [Niveomyces insectorum RCEF 264]|uniref:Transcriptional regulatory protein n=1 Tax=Niveomyces insectorum RCEF 264 TaxID=1081102 RepID=A0A167QS57_9HYPO|nr:transcriptional regulatory protein [Niveomyces insectorum RCEF 264]
MAAAEPTAAAFASSPPPFPFTAHSPSNASSPLTEVEDKDGDPDDMDLDGPMHDSPSVSNANPDDDDDDNDEDEDGNGDADHEDDASQAVRSRSASDNEDESALSEVEPDVNDSEAETERLYDTPVKAKNIKDGVVDADSSPEAATVTTPSRRLAQKRERAFQASPSKLKQQLHADSDGASDADADADGDNDDEALSDAEDEENNEADGEEEAVADDRDVSGSLRRRRSATTGQAKKAVRTGSLPTAADKADAERADAKDETPAPPTTPALLRSQRSNSDTRKRKRSPTTDPSESDQPLRKRLGSSGGNGGGGSGVARDAAAAAADKEKKENGEKKTGTKSRNGNGDDRGGETAAGARDAKSTPAENSAEGTSSDTFRARRSKRGNAKKHKGSDDGDGDGDNDGEGGADAKGEQNADALDDALDDGEAATAEEDAAGQGDDEQLDVDHEPDHEGDGDIDEEAEAAHRNEEESTDKPFLTTTTTMTMSRLKADWGQSRRPLNNADDVAATVERKKAALDNLHAIEKQFASFRDKLYQERLEQLNQEEAMLLGDSPTHPEYLAMMQCVNERRDEKLRVSDVEYQFNMQTLKRWAVGRRSQIHGQYFQSVRESRELVLEELGRQWYQIQQQRRRHANTIPDYGLRFPASKAQRTKDAITYNKEVSILAGIAKYEGFPAAPPIKGASAVQVDDDLEAIAQRRRPSESQLQVQAAPHPGPVAATAYPELAAGALGTGASYAGPVSFDSLGSAGQQFLADTPWANPHHPSHHVQRQKQEPQGAHAASPYPGGVAPPAAPPPSVPVSVALPVAMPVPSAATHTNSQKPWPPQPPAAGSQNGQGNGHLHHPHPHHFDYVPTPKDVTAKAMANARAGGATNGAVHNDAAGTGRLKLGPVSIPST